jgi:dsDNA-specific endonuclease/ATPase MutS2
MKREIDFMRQNKTDLDIAHSLSVKETECEAQKQQLQTQHSRLKKMHSDLVKRSQMLEELLKQCNDETKEHVSVLRNNEMNHHIMLQKLDSMLQCNNSRKRTLGVVEQVAIQNSDGTVSTVQVEKLQPSGIEALRNALGKYMTVIQDTTQPAPSASLCQ